MRRPPWLALTTGRKWRGMRDFKKFQEFGIWCDRVRIERLFQKWRGFDGRDSSGPVEAIGFH
jgi:hypothetical protein